MPVRYNLVKDLENIFKEDSLDKKRTENNLEKSSRTRNLVEILKRSFIYQIKLGIGYKLLEQQRVVDFIRSMVLLMGGSHGRL